MRKWVQQVVACDLAVKLVVWCQVVDVCVWPARAGLQPRAAFVRWPDNRITHFQTRLLDVAETGQ
eukprot:11211082-Lingulodinium_polyedra.AAC.1